MKNTKKLSSIFKQGGSPAKKTLSSTAFMPADMYYNMNYQLGGLAGYGLNNRTLKRMQNGDIASAYSAMQAAASSPQSNWRGVPFPTPQWQGAPFLTPEQMASGVVAGADDSLPTNIPGQPGSVVLPGAPESISSRLAATAAAPQDPFVYVKQKEGETRWQYRYDPTNNVWQAMDTRRPEKGWMIPDPTKTSGIKADKAIRDRYQQDADSALNSKAEALQKAQEAEQEVINRMAASAPMPAIGSTLGPIESQAQRTIMMGGQRTPVGAPTSTVNPAAQAPTMSSGAPFAPEPAPQWQGAPFLTPEQTSAQVDTSGVTFSPMNPAEAQAIRDQRGPLPLNLKPVQSTANRYTIENNPAANKPVIQNRVSKNVDGFRIDATETGDVFITDKNGDLFALPEELLPYVENLEGMSSRDLKDLIREFKGTISDPDLREYYKASNRMGGQRPDAARPTLTRRGAGNYTMNRRDGGGTSYFRDIADSLSSESYPQGMQTGGVPSMMGTMLANPTMADRLANVMKSTAQTPTMSNLNTGMSAMTPQGSFYDGGMPEPNFVASISSVRKTDPIRDFISSPYKISSPAFEDYSRGDSVPQGIEMTRTIMKGFGNPMMKNKR
jgi:hypothetical protein